MTWTLILSLGVVAWFLKLLGAVIVGQRTMPPVLERCLMLIPASMLAGLIAKDTFTVGRHIGLDARAVGLGVAAFATWRRWPFALTVLFGVGATAAVRHLS